MATTADLSAPLCLVERNPCDQGYGYEYTVYESITSHVQLSHLSFEELRWRHYSASSKTISSAANNAATLPTNTPQAISRMEPMAQPVPSPESITRSSLVRDAPENHYKLHSDVIIFLVGPSPPQKFKIHEGVLGTSSNFVRLALRGEWKEAAERTIPMPDDDPAVSSLYQSWLYTSKILTRSKQTTPEIDSEYKLLVKAYILGEKIDDQNFKDCIADALVEKHNTSECFDTNLAGLVFGGTPAGSPLRKLWLDIYVHFGQAEWITSESPSDSASVEFLVEFSRRSMEQHRSVFSATLRRINISGCTYHGHGFEPCYRVSKHGTQ